MSQDVYSVFIKFESLGNTEIALSHEGAPWNAREFALKIYGEIRKNYTKPENVSLVRYVDGKPRKVVLSDLEKEALGIKD
ncbi:MAG: hypothetical protein AABW51_01290 [Nanoarchaeota archaeon]